MQELNKLSFKQLVDIAERRGVTAVNKLSLEQLVEEACRLGRVSMMQHKDAKWSCSIEMHVSCSNILFESKSGFGHTALSHAVEAAVENAKHALQELGVLI